MKRFYIHLESSPAEIEAALPVDVARRLFAILEHECRGRTIDCPAGQSGQGYWIQAALGQFADLHGEEAHNRLWMILCNEINRPPGRPRGTPSHHLCAGCGGNQGRIKPMADSWWHIRCHARATDYRRMWAQRRFLGIGAR